MECAILQNGSSDTAIPDDATDKIIFPFDLSATTITFHRYVSPVLPLPIHKNTLLVIRVISSHYSMKDV